MICQLHTKAQQLVARQCQDYTDSTRLWYPHIDLSAPRAQCRAAVQCSAVQHWCDATSLVGTKPLAQVSQLQRHNGNRVVRHKTRWKGRRLQAREAAGKVSGRGRCSSRFGRTTPHLHEPTHEI